MRNVVFLVDGMFMRRRVFEKKLFYYSARAMRNYCRKHLKQDDCLLRIYYYDCLPLRATGTSPLTGNTIRFFELESAKQRYKLLESLRTTPHVASRLGHMEWNGRDWSIVGSKVASVLARQTSVEDLTDEDIRPAAEPSGIEVKMALDMVRLARKDAADLFVLVTDRSDLVPALEEVREEGKQVSLDSMNAPCSHTLEESADIVATVVGDYVDRKESSRNGSSGEE